MSTEGDAPLPQRISIEVTRQPKPKLYRCDLLCADCGEVLNTARHVPEHDKSKVTIASALVAGQCPKGCRSTWSDCNINTELRWSEESQSGG